MSVTLWLDTAREQTVELGPTLPVYAAFAEMARAVGPAWRTTYPDLAGVLTQCETQDDADPSWLAGVRTQARLFLQRSPRLSPSAREILSLLADTPSR